MRFVRPEGSSPDATRPALLDLTGRAHERYGAAEPCFFLIRPDGHVGFRGTSPDGERLRAHLGRILVDEAAPLQQRKDWLRSPGEDSRPAQVTPSFARAR